MYFNKPKKYLWIHYQQIDRELDWQVETMVRPTVEELI